MYSQNDEEQYILSYFADKPAGNFLDIGAFSPFTFSNTRALYERGFGGVFVEPSPSLVGAFQKEYADEPRIQLLEVCVGAQNGEVDFFDSQGDAISTTIEAETLKWTTTDFRKITRPMVTVPELLKRARYDRFAFITVDTEGNVFEIFDQLDLNALGCEMICLEWAGRDFEAYHAKLTAQGLRPIAINPENLLYGRGVGPMDEQMFTRNGITPPA